MQRTVSSRSVVFRAKEFTNSWERREARFTHSVDRVEVHGELHRARRGRRYRRAVAFASMQRPLEASHSLSPCLESSPESTREPSSALRDEVEGRRGQRVDSILTLGASLFALSGVASPMSLESIRVESIGGASTSCGAWSPTAFAGSQSRAGGKEHR